MLTRSCFHFLVASLLWTAVGGNLLSNPLSHAPLEGREIFEASTPEQQAERFATSELSESPNAITPRDIFGRQSRCPYPVMCNARTCCPAGTQCVRLFHPHHFVAYCFDELTGIQPEKVPGRWLLFHQLELQVRWKVLSQKCRDVRRHAVCRSRGCVLFRTLVYAGVSVQ